MRPNLLFVVAHDLGKVNSVYGAGVATPNLKAFSTKATCFTNAFATASTCSPSRASMMTGLYPHQNGLVGLTHLGFRLTRTDRHLARLLRDVGYRTILSGVQHEAPTAAEVGYTDYIGLDPQMVYDTDFDPVPWDEENAAACARFLCNTGEMRRDQPWFLCLGLFLPHRPFPQPDKLYEDLVSVPGLPPTEAVLREMRGFHQAAWEMDRSIGTVLSAVHEAGLDENTLVVVVTDHGIDMPRYKNTLSDGGLATTLLIRTPGQRNRRIYTGLVSLLDLYPTILDSLSVPHPNDMNISDARSIALGAADAAPPDDPRKYAFSAINYHVAYQPERAVTTDRYRLVRRYHSMHRIPSNIGDSPSKDAFLLDHPPASRNESSGDDEPQWSLYDRWYDPLQNNDLFETVTPAATTIELQTALNRWMAETGDPLLNGIVPQPEGATVAPVDSYSSWTADTMNSRRESP